MPLAGYEPQIDTRRYDDIMAELKARIARYTPEWNPVWTDFNDSDPGITLVQLFAWLSDMLLYRMGRVPELNYIKFLELLNIQLRAAEPATADITFPVRATHTAPTVDVPMRTQVSATADDGTPVVFETDRAIHALTAALDSIQTHDGAEYRTVPFDVGPDGFQPLGRAPARDHAVYLGFLPPAAAGAKEFPGGELDLWVWAAGTEAPASVSCAAPRAHASANLAWEYFGATGWRTLSVLSDDTLALTRSGHVRLRLPAPGTLAATPFGRETVAHYWIRARVERAAYERPPALRAVRTNTVHATQAQSVTAEILGGSDGSRAQIFKLAHTPVLHATLELVIDEGSGFKPWTRVDDFYASGPAEHHYLLDRTTGEIVLGDGINGHAPAANALMPGENVVARAYRFGGGPQGNVPSGAISSLMTSIEGIDDNGIENLAPAAGGRPEETLEEAARRAPRTVRSRGRAVTAEDFEELAEGAANIRRAKALPHWHPGFPGVTVPGAVSVIVVPDAETKGSGRVANPTPSEGTMRTVCECLNQARLITTELFVLPPTYQLVAVKTEIVAAADADLARVRLEIEQSLNDYFHPLIGGDDRNGWPFGGDIAFSRVFQRIAEVPGVARIDSVLISVDGREMPECRNIPVCEGMLLYSTGHDVQVNYEVTT